jgi:ribose/xylose/arabinose/galactoside ABC-type transport system permease subunit/ABC-type sugar transport system substrate-binding protein
MKTVRQILPVIIALILICVIMSILSPNFLTVNNITNVIMQASINAVIAGGMTFVILTAGIDLSVGSVVAFVGIILGFSLHAGIPVIIAILIALLVGGLCGLFNGILITKGKLPPFIVTLGMMSIARGAALMLNNGRPVSGFTESFRFIANGKLAGVPVMILITVVVYIICFVILRRTPFGRYVYSIGGNEEATRLSGINTKKVLIWVYVICGILAGLASVMLTSRINSAQPTAGLNYELDAIAATVIGGTSLMGGFGFVSGTLVGALIMSVIRNGLNLLNVSSFLQQVIIGCVIILAVLVDSLRNRSGSFDIRLFFKKYFIPLIVVLVLIAGGFIYYGCNAYYSGKKIKIAFIMKTLNNQFFIDMEEGAREELKKYPKYEIIVQAPERETDVEMQMRMVENMITQEVDAICIAPCADKDILPAIQKANEANIPVIIVDSKVDDKLAKKMGVHYAVYIGSDNYRGGEIAADYLSKMLGGKGNVALIEGVPGSASVGRRKDGFIDALKQYSGIKLIASQTANCERNLAYNVTQNILQAHSDLNAIFAVNNVMTLGCSEAVKQAGYRGKIKIVGFDGDDEIYKAIQNGDILGSVIQFPRLIGKAAVKNAIKLINGEAVHHAQYTNIKLVTKKDLLIQEKAEDKEV